MGKVLPVAIGAVVIIGAGVWFFVAGSQGGEVNTLVSTNSYSTSTPQVLESGVGGGSTNSTSSPQASSPTTPNQQKIMQATVHTNKGDITIEFMSADAPNTVANFTKLAGEGYYNGTKFHRVIKGFMIQGGDPLTKDDAMMARWGTGGPGYQFGDEIHAKNYNNIGTIAMANSGPNTNGSQFFINVANNNFLDAKHTVFGKVTAGMDVVTAIENTPTGQADRPTTAVVIQGIDLK